MNFKIFYSIEEASQKTRLPSLLIKRFLRLKEKAITPELLPDLNPTYVKGEPFFTQKDIQELLDYIDKRKDESWDAWHTRRVKEAMAKRESEQKKKHLQRPDLRIMKGKKGNKGDR
ncbi:MAG: hypothetical protein DRG87_07830 [Deltaproteobacteria bacterium]|nr:MAG: hypothetical protein DRG87_07830 [Deltaproteobacteria bacterium]